MPLQLLSHAEQVAAHLRGELLRSRWSGVMPGILTLGKELGVNHNTIDAALQLLEQEKLLETQGRGKPRRIVPQTGGVRRALRVRILLFEPADRVVSYNVELLHHLNDAGHVAAFARKTQTDLGMNVKRIARYVEESEFDAWVVCAAYRDVLEWFAEQSFPTFAMFGRMSGLPVAGMSPRKALSLAMGLRRLVALGHRKIVMMTRGVGKFANPSLHEQGFLDELKAMGITPGAYHLPDWEDTHKDFHRCLDSLFRLTPPTALIVCEPAIFIAAQQHLAHRGILAPRDVSLMCDDPCHVFDWCEQTIAHIKWDERPILHRVVRWADNVAHGRTDRRQSRCKSVFVDGGTIGPVTG